LEKFQRTKSDLWSLAGVKKEEMVQKGSSETEEHEQAPTEDLSLSGLII
jgi:hypothetical protein